MKIGTRKVVVEGNIFKDKREACEAYGVSYKHMRNVLRRGFSLEQALGVEEMPPKKVWTDCRWEHKKEAWELEEERGERKCTKCGETKSLELFPIHKDCKHNRANVCKMCKTEKSRKSRYGVDNVQYFQMLEKQKGCCAICGTDEPQTRGATSFCVDHCHKTGEVRGLLCMSCNAGLGKFKDNTEFLYSAIDYLLKAREGVKE